MLLETNAVPLLPHLGFTAAAALPRANLRVLAFNMHGTASDRAEFRERSRNTPTWWCFPRYPVVSALQAETPQLPPYMSGEPKGMLDSTVLFSRWSLTNVRDVQTSKGEAGILTGEV